MSTKYKQKGETLAYTNATGSDISSGDVVVIGNHIGVAEVDIANGSSGTVRVKGVHTLTKTTSKAATQGQALFWDSDNEYITTTPTAYFAGFAHAAAAQATATVDVDLWPTMTRDDSGYIFVPLGGMTLEDGTAIGKFSDGASATPGIQQVSNKEQVLRWNNYSQATKVGASVVMPGDLDGTQDVTLHWLAKMSGSTDSPTIEHEAYFNAGDTDCAGTDDEIDGEDTLTEYNATIQASNVPSPPAALTVIFGPKAGEIGTDDVLVYGFWIEYNRANVGA